jgi:hypothetical protein
MVKRYSVETNGMLVSVHYKKSRAKQKVDKLRREGRKGVRLITFNVTRK